MGYQECYVVIRDEDNATLAIIQADDMDSAVKIWASSHDLDFEDAVGHYSYMNRALITKEDK